LRLNRIDYWQFVTRNRDGPILVALLVYWKS
jgi:hypothetical protein